MRDIVYNLYVKQKHIDYILPDPGTRLDKSYFVSFMAGVFGITPDGQSVIVWVTVCDKEQD